MREKREDRCDEDRGNCEKHAGMEVGQFQT